MAPELPPWPDASSSDLAPEPKRPRTTADSLSTIGYLDAITVGDVPDADEEHTLVLSGCLDDE